MKRAPRETTPDPDEPHDVLADDRRRHESALDWLAKLGFDLRADDEPKAKKRDMKRLVVKKTRRPRSAA